MTKILDGKVNFPLCLAPMVGLSHIALRLVILDYLPRNAFTIWPTEMLNSRRLPNENVGFTAETFRHQDEHFLVPQILGNEEKAIKDSIAILENWGASAIDINMGCPVQKALKHNYGVALMGDANYAAEVVHMAVASTKLPVSVKLRIGSEQDKSVAGDINENFLLNFTKKLEQAGASWLCLHPRTAEQKRRGSADWSQIKFLKDHINIPVIGNGDIQTAEDVLAMIEQTHCDMVMSGRALAARPWMLWQLGEKLGLQNPVNHPGLAPQTPEEEAQEYGKALLKLIDFADIYFANNFKNPELALRKIRFHIKTTSVWLDFGHELFAISTQAKTIADLKDLVKVFFNKPIRMFQRTDLRQ